MGLIPKTGARYRVEYGWNEETDDGMFTIVDTQGAREFGWYEHGRDAARQAHRLNETLSKLSPGSASSLTTSREA